MFASRRVATLSDASFLPQNVRFHQPHCWLLHCSREFVAARAFTHQRIWHDLRNLSFARDKYTSCCYNDVTTLKGRCLYFTKSKYRKYFNVRSNLDVIYLFYFHNDDSIKYHFIISRSKELDSYHSHFWHTCAAFSLSYTKKKIFSCSHKYTYFNIISSF